MHKDSRKRRGVPVGWSRKHGDSENLARQHDRESFNLVKHAGYVTFQSLSQLVHAQHYRELAEANPETVQSVLPVEECFYSHISLESYLNV